MHHSRRIDQHVADLDGRLVSLLRAGPADVEPVVVPLFREYGEWVAARLERDEGVTFTSADLERHHEGFHAELPQLLGPRGRLLIGYVDHEPVGVGALKPVDARTAEIKRMFVRPTSQGRGVGRAILTGLIEHARAEACAIVRLETLRFMTAAQVLYRSVGFVPAAPYDGSEAATTVLDPFTIFMELDLAHRAAGEVGIGHAVA